MSDERQLRPELREEMGDWVMGYVAGRRRRRRRLTTLGVSVVALAALGGASAWVVLAPQSVVERSVVCYAEPSTSSPSIGGGFTGDAPIGDPGANAVSLCSSLWQLGKLSQDGSSSHRVDGTRHPVPDLVLCTRTDGTYVVVPARNPGSAGAGSPSAVDRIAFCDALGLVPPPHY